MRKNLKRSRRLPWLDRLFVRISPSSSILLKVSSGLLPIVAIEAPVCRFSAVEVGGADSGFLLELFLDSHANGPVSFLVGAGAGFSSVAGGAGGGGNLTGDIRPERPCSEPVESWEARGGSFGTEPGVFVPSTSCQFQSKQVYEGWRVASECS